MVHFSKDERLAVFIDGGSLSAAVSALEFDVDFRRVQGFFRDAANLIRIYFFAAIPAENASIRPLLDWLDYNDYSVAAKSGRSVAGADGKLRSRCDFGVDLAVEALRVARSVDHLALVSGDGRYRALVAGLQNMGVRVSAISTLHPHPMIDSDLRRQADQFIDLVDLKQHFERTVDAPAAAQ